MNIPPLAMFVCLLTRGLREGEKFSTHDRLDACQSVTLKLATRGGTPRGTEEAIELDTTCSNITATAHHKPLHI